MHSILWGEFHCQQFAISDIIILFSRVSRAESTWKHFDKIIIIL